MQTKAKIVEIFLEIIRLSLFVAQWCEIHRRNVFLSHRKTVSFRVLSKGSPYWHFSEILTCFSLMTFWVSSHECLYFLHCFVSKDRRSSIPNGYSSRISWLNLSQFSWVAEKRFFCGFHTIEQQKAKVSWCPKKSALF